MTWVEATMLVTGVLLWIALFCLVFYIAMEKDDWPPALRWGTVTVVVVALCVPIVAIVKDMGDEGNSCRETGGHKVQTGTTPIWTGKMFVMVPEYTCVLQQEEMG